MSILEEIIEIPVEHEQNVFGQFDAFAKKIERTLHVTLIARDGKVKILGDAARVSQAKRTLTQLTALSERGNTITEQNVDYALSLVLEDQEAGIVEIDKDIICHTLQGKPIKPKTLGQKKYVDAIRDQMIVFGLGPAGTGKTYLAMAMACHRGRRKTWIFAGRSAEQDRSLFKTALRCTVSDHGGGELFEKFGKRVD